jgi:pimeloyl-ACP methyl ester carboxylesterase
MHPHTYALNSTQLTQLACALLTYAPRTHSLNSHHTHTHTHIHTHTDTHTHTQTHTHTHTHTHTLFGTVDSFATMLRTPSSAQRSLVMAHSVIFPRSTSPPSVPPAASSQSAVYLLHGLLGHGRLWGSFARRLCERIHLPVVTCDLRAHGDSVELSHSPR